MKNPNRLWLIVGFFAATYGLLHFLYFLGDPLGQVPVLDARENFIWAERIASSSLPPEPIYRALLYPWVLAQFPAASLPMLASLFGLLMHGLSALLVARIAQRLWHNILAARVAGLLYAVYPVALYFAVMVLDITFATTLFLGGLLALLNAGRHSNWRRALAWALGAALLGGLAVLARPNFLPAVLLFPLLGLFSSLPNRLGRAICLAVGISLTLGLQGALNYKLSGEIRLLPWQGAYNLFKANSSEANGKYYMQSVFFQEVAAGSNTTRMESEWLYREQAGADAPLTVEAMNTHWRAALVREIQEDPSRWLGLMIRKVVYAANNWEQYNNLTYAYQKARLPYLRWNPLGWGLLLIAAAAGLFLGRTWMDRRAFYALALLAAAYLAGLLLFFISARFRLPLAPLLCVAAGGCVFFRPQPGWRQPALLGGGACLIGVLTFGNWFGAHDRAPFIQDEILLARASSQSGDDAAALQFAQAVLKRDAERPEARKIEVTSLFNLWLTTGEPDFGGAAAEALAQLETTDASIEFIRGVFQWRAGQADSAIATWERAVANFGSEAVSSQQALRVVGAVQKEARFSGPPPASIRRVLGL